MGQRGKRAKGTGNNDYKGNGNGRPPEDTAYKHSTRSGQGRKTEKESLHGRKETRKCVGEGKCDKEKREKIVHRKENGTGT